MRPPTRKASPLTSSSSTDPDLVLVGRIIRPHGLRGAVVVEPFTDDPSTRFAPGSSLLMAGGRSVEVARYEPTDRFPIVTLVGFATRDDAEQIRGRALYIESRARRPLGANEFWPDQLQGLPVVAREGTTIGVVVDVETGLSQDRLLVDTGDGVLMIPLVAALVPEVDLHGGRVVVDLPAGFTEEG